MSIPTGTTPYYEDDLITLYRANALNLPLADDSGAYAVEFLRPQTTTTQGVAA